MIDAMRLQRVLMAVAAAVWGSNLVAIAAEPGQFRQLHSLIKPQSNEESWLKIRWLTSLWEARERAAAEGKPILLWEMDGHPLGCT